MDKQIVTLGTDPFYLGLADRECSLFVNPRTGDILMDEGDGEGRVNGAVLFADKEPRFHTLPGPDAGGQLLLSYRKHLFTLGDHENLVAMRDWADTANGFLAKKHPGADLSSASESEEPPASGTKPLEELFQQVR